MLSKYASEIESLFSSFGKEREDAVAPTREQFIRLLAFPSAARRVPGIPKIMDENGEYICSEEEALLVRDFLHKLHRIDSKDSLIGFQKYQFKSSVQYEQFMTFRKGAPLFDVNKLEPDARKGFDHMMALARPFYPLLEEKGFYAFDISEYITICRIARACGIIDGNEFEEIVDRFVRKAQVFYHSFYEYAMSYICGALYFSASNFGMNGIDQFFDIQKNLLNHLFDENGNWNYYKWYVPAEREWVQIYPGNPGCVVTKAAMEKGIGYMYRDTALSDRPDSGWRFFHGDEPDEYANDPNNLQIVGINTICNMNPTVLAFLEAPVNSAFGWNGKDWIRESK